jgi:HSP20 family protein
MVRATSIKTRIFNPQYGDAISATVAAFRSRRIRAFLVRLRDRLNGLLNRLLGERQSDLLGRFHIRDQEGVVTVRVEIPGVEAEELDVNVQDNLLIVRAFMPVGTNGEKRESDDLSFQESYDCAFLPSAVDAAEMEATYCDGVLTVTLPEMERRKLGGGVVEASRTKSAAPTAEVARGTRRRLRNDLTQWPLRAFERAAGPLDIKHAGNVRHCG